MGTTTKHALRYPEPGDPADVPTDMNELATDVDNALPPVPGTAGQWLKSGASGAMLWSAIAVGDLPFAGQPNGVATLDATGKVPAAQIPATAGAGLVKIADVALAAAAATIDVSSIPATYAALRLYCLLRSGAAGGLDVAGIQFNGSAAGYSYQLLRGLQATASGSEFFSQASGRIANIAGSTAGAGYFTAVAIDIPQYAGGSPNNRAYLSQWTWFSGTATGQIDTGQIGGNWASPGAINRVTISAGANFAIGSRMIVYGLT